MCDSHACCALYRRRRFVYPFIRGFSSNGSFRLESRFSRARGMAKTFASPRSTVLTGARAGIPVASSSRNRVCEYNSNETAARRMIRRVAADPRHRGRLHGHSGRVRGLGNSGCQRGDAGGHIHERRRRADCDRRRSAVHPRDAEQPARLRAERHLEHRYAHRHANQHGAPAAIGRRRTVRPRRDAERQACVRRQQHFELGHADPRLYEHTALRDPGRQRAEPRRDHTQRQDRLHGQHLRQHRDADTRLDQHRAARGPGRRVPQLGRDHAGRQEHSTSAI